MSYKALSAIGMLVAMFTAVSVFAADDDAKIKAAASTGEARFDHRIDTWVDGTVMSLDADTGKFSIRGSKMPYATAHCSMLKDVHAKTANLDAAKNQERETEVRKAWADRLAVARTEKREAAGDYTFALPAQGKLSALNMSSLKNADWLRGDMAMNAETPKTDVTADVKAERPIATGAGIDVKEAQALMALKDMKVGDKVMIGYDSGVITNEAYVVVKHDKDMGAKPGSTR